MNFNNEIFNNLEEAHRRRVEFFTQHHDEDDENLNVNEKIDLFNSLIEKKGEQGLVVLTRFKITEFKHIVEIWVLSHQMVFFECLLSKSRRPFQFILTFCIRTEKVEQK